MEQEKICLRQGCRKKYKESENTHTSCKYHDGNPIFHDLRKGWTCCNKIVHDWDEFQKIEGCKTANHTDIKQETNFFKSQNVTNDESIETENSQKVLNIEEYEKQKELEKKLKEEKPKEIVKNKEGKYFCSNPGCTSKVFDPEDNKEGDCMHHKGNPMFHDRKKFWTCCKAEAFDWDDFMKLPTCNIGKHMPKYK